MSERPTYNGVKVIHASHFRMASKSLAEAYKILGYPTCHLLDDIFGCRWELIEQATDAKWPYVPCASRNPKQLSREQWDEVWKPCEAVAALAGLFVPELVDAYPDAKVVVVQRDFDTWWASFKSEVLDSFYNRQVAVLGFFAQRLLGYRIPATLNKIYLGFFDVQDPAEIESNARAAYDRFYAEIRAAVPEDRRLEYKMGTGWGPLCEFLDKEIPDQEFPFVNTRAEHSAGEKTRIRETIVMVAKAVLPYLGGAVVCGCAIWYMM